MDPTERQKIRELEPAVTNYNALTVNLTEEQLRAVMGRLKTAPIVALSLDPGWIPCKVRQPEKDGDYIASFKAESGDFVEICCFEDGHWVVYFEDEKALVSNVVAWMPLPEVYKEVGND